MTQDSIEHPRRTAFWKIWTAVTLVADAALIVLLFLNLAYGYQREDAESAGYDAKEEWLLEMQTSYNGMLARLVDETQNYIDSLAPSSGLRALPLVRECVSRKIPVALALAQGENESLFGTKGLAKKTNSVWNVGAYDSLSVNHVTRYSHPNEAIVPYLELLDTKYLHNKCVEDLLEKFVNDKGKRYASDPYYEQKLKDKYFLILSNTKIQLLQDRVDWYSLRL